MRPTRPDLAGPPGRGTPLWLAGIYAGIGALVANHIVLYFAKPLAPDLMALSPGPVTFWTVLGAVGATLVYELVRRRSQTPARTFTIVAVIALLISFIPDLLLFRTPVSPTFGNATGGGIYTLMAMHCVAAVIVTGVLTRVARPARP
jgi:hypothetical protein